MQSRAESIAAIRALPAQLREKVAGLTSEQLTAAYNAPEWTIAQNIHHLADTHMVCIRRFKLILTSPSFQFTGYDVNAIAEMPDAKDADIEYSLQILAGLHARWAILLENLSEDDWAKTGIASSPDRPDYSLEDLARLYARHGLNHLQQIQEVLDAMPA
ncbi:MAG: DinB family protein [Chloroflexi bacterium]|nr:DinB family protein [Chloroflexota bacterium]MCY3582691.1 DinB family protein [Chloroflexota bacterium]MCY3714852.1 DinB family protein [Chloroflexota bacterium]MDE2650953.1 DinB family protein [Chloroflexota bacterium]MXV93305.1 metal-dependent hydrolase [Chloroflexota bacterium]